VNIAAHVHRHLQRLQVLHTVPTSARPPSCRGIPFYAPRRPPLLPTAPFLVPGSSLASPGFPS
jgi:hypothetical protein